MKELNNDELPLQLIGLLGFLFVLQSVGNYTIIRYVLHFWYWEKKRFERVPPSATVPHCRWIDVFPSSSTIPVKRGRTLAQVSICLLVEWISSMTSWMRRWDKEKLFSEIKHMGYNPISKITPVPSQLSKDCMQDLPEGIQSRPRKGEK